MKVKRVRGHSAWAPGAPPQLGGGYCAYRRPRPDRLSLLGRRLDSPDGRYSPVSLLRLPKVSKSRSGEHASY
ncbi:Hypothetical protein NTJ_05112 [Nesidiocoris tenuis]|uniref:Uncharacterized protein n=1 Tax=Nesidiocoris tenuis TaxID=355587 RepID=A0ABN7AJ89_9HEMI|nr:Hypothetical protein NTJ_05112 [Nesidiocoris tenuis]